MSSQEHLTGHVPVECKAYFLLTGSRDIEL
jgi:hypothetical protein